MSEIEDALWTGANHGFGGSAMGDPASISDQRFAGFVARFARVLRELPGEMTVEEILLGLRDMRR